MLKKILLNPLKNLSKKNLTLFLLQIFSFSTHFVENHLYNIFQYVL